MKKIIKNTPTQRKILQTYFYKYFTYLYKCNIHRKKLEKGNKEKNKPAVSNYGHGNYAKRGKSLHYFTQDKVFIPPKIIKKTIDLLKPIENEILL